MTEDEYWVAIKRVPLYRDRDSTDGRAVICRDVEQRPVFVEKPEFLSPEKRRAAAQLYKSMYGQNVC